MDKYSNTHTGGLLQFSHHVLHADLSIAVKGSVEAHSVGRVALICSRTIWFLRAGLMSR